MILFALTAKTRVRAELAGGYLPSLVVSRDDLRLAQWRKTQMAR